MPAIAYPVAHNALDIVLNWGEGVMSSAERERAAKDACGKDVTFVRETLDPGFPSEEAARAQYENLLTEPFATLICTFERTQKPRRVETQMQDGRRWPKAEAAPAAQWKLCLSYWKIGAVRSAPKPSTGITPHLQARAVRKKELDVPLTPEEVQALAHAPLMAYRPQKALDMGLFEFVLPENPDIIIADE
ncbi:hypothetical protein [Asticcacaulis sp. AND118]|uniref:hypothetical protein n=1 Tax=Asticcacaulis sp. AND118 TaxID=2840468 RepID=UPI001CFF8687|nr:hypothetical protein [Asticcacaulis sp. AND118]UDF03614.1 hypothetical protein LH365_00815 [Asticcacaulis sp. AND118]